MYYYDPNNRNPRRWATVATAVYALLLIGSFALVSFDFRQIHDKPGDTITIDFTEPPAPEPPKPRVRTATEPRVHDRTAPVEQTAQVSGKDETTQTPNPRALFNMNKGGADEPDNAGNPRAPEGEDKASGTGPGLNPDGLDQLDQGLQGRGLVGDLPKPSYPGSKSGKVIVRVRSMLRDGSRVRPTNRKARPPTPPNWSKPPKPRRARRALPRAARRCRAERSPMFSVWSNF